jgi:hypothetical protein
VKASAKKTGFDELQAELKAVQRKAPTEGQRVLKRGAQNIKNGAVQRLRGKGFLPHIHRAVNYDVTWRGHRGSAEIGFDKTKRQGPLGNVVEYGTVNNAPQPVLAPELELEEPRLEAEVERMGREMLE